MGFLFKSVVAYWPRNDAPLYDANACLAPCLRGVLFSFRSASYLLIKRASIFGLH